MSVPTPNRPVHSSQRVPPVQAKNPLLATSRERAILGLLLLGFGILAFLFRNPFMGQWDSFDYVTKTLRHQVSDLAFGRPLFLGINRVMWEGANRVGVSVFHAYRVAQTVVGGFAIWGLVCFYSCVKRVGGVRLALFGVAWLATTPMYLAYSGMVMTEVPSLACLLAAVALLLRWEVSRNRFHLVLSAVLFAAGLNIREQLITAAAVFPLMIFLDQGRAWREKISAVLLHAGVYALGVLGALLFFSHTDPNFWHRVRGWAAVIPIGTHGVGIQLAYLVGFAFVNCGVALAVALWTWRKWSTVLPVRALVAGLAFIPLVALLPNADLRIQPRYELLAAPAIILAALMGLTRALTVKNLRARHTILALLLAGHGVFFTGGIITLTRFNRLSLERKVRVEGLLERAPRAAAFVGGAYTPILEFYRQSGIRPGWNIIRSGWDWDRANLQDQIAGELGANHPVLYLNDAKVWDYLREEQADVEALRTQFQFVRVDSGIERIELRKGRAF